MTTAPTGAGPGSCGNGTDALTIAPLIDYFVRKTEEIDKIRFAVIGIKNGVDREEIKEKIKNA